MAERPFTLDDMLQQFRQVRKMGGLKDMSSMTDEERADPRLFEDEPLRRSHVAERSGTSAEEVAGLLGLYRSLQKFIAAGGPEGLVGPGPFGFPGPTNVPGLDSELN